MAAVCRVGFGSRGFDRVPRLVVSDRLRLWLVGVLGMARELVGMWSSDVSHEEVYAAVVAFVDAKPKSEDGVLMSEGIGVDQAGTGEDELRDLDGGIAGGGK